MIYNYTHILSHIIHMLMSDLYSHRATDDSKECLWRIVLMKQGCLQRHFHTSCLNFIRGFKVSLVPSLLVSVATIVTPSLSVAMESQWEYQDIVLLACPASSAGGQWTTGFKGSALILLKSNELSVSSSISPIIALQPTCKI